MTHEEFAQNLRRIHTSVVPPSLFDDPNWVAIIEQQDDLVNQLLHRLSDEELDAFMRVPLPNDIPTQMVQKVRNRGYHEWVMRSIARSRPTAWEKVAGSWLDE